MGSTELSAIEKFMAQYVMVYGLIVGKLSLRRLNLTKLKTWKTWNFDVGCQVSN